MRKRPVILLAFANDKQAYLSHLAEEERQLRRELEQLHQEERIELLSLGHSSLEDIYRHFNLYHNRIIGFHFGGHSGHSLLQLSDGAAQSRNLAKLLGMQHQLRYVLLNGCANRGQVQALFDEGVPVVIATHVPVEDSMARLFAQQFYQAMVSGKTLEEAFDTAEAHLSDKGLLKDGQTVRGLDLSDAGKFPWGLFYQDKAALSWRLPAPPEPVMKPEEADLQREVKLSRPEEMHKTMMELIASGVGTYHRRVNNELEDLLQEPNNPMMFADLQNGIIQKFPSLISVHLNELCTLEGKSKGRTRLHVINHTYRALSKFLCFIAFSSLWERIEEEGVPSNFGEELHRGLSALAGVAQKKEAALDYLWLAGTACQVFEREQLACHVPELLDFHRKLYSDKACFDAYRFLENELRQPLLQNAIPAEQVERLCIHGSESLGRLLEMAAFISSYQLVSINDIRVMKYRRAKPVFHHENALLRGENIEKIHAGSLVREDYTDHRSVFIARDIYSGGQEVLLNLSPFIIDSNTYRDKKKDNRSFKAKLYFFCGWEEAETVCFEHAIQFTDPLWRVGQQVENEEYEGLEAIIEQFQQFRQSLRLA